MGDEESIGGKGEGIPPRMKHPKGKQNGRVPPWDEATARTLEDWYVRVTAAQYGHQARSDLARKRYLVLGLPAIILATIVGTSVFATATNEPVSILWKSVVGTVSVLAAVLAGIQTFLGFGQLAEKHRVAAFRYANLRRDISLALARKDSSQVDKFRREMDKIGAEGPQIGDLMWTRSLTRAQKEPRPWIASNIGKSESTTTGPSGS